MKGEKQPFEDGLATYGTAAAASSPAGDGDRPRAAPHTTITERWCRFLLNHKRPVFCAWVIVVAISIPAALSAVSRTVLDFDPPSGSPSYLAHCVLAEHFPHLTATTNLVVAISDPTGGDIRTDAVEEFSMRLNESVMGWRQGYVMRVEGYYLVPTELKDRFLSRGNASTIITILATGEPSASDAHHFTSWLENYIVGGGVPDGYESSMIGTPLFESAAQSAARHDLRLVAGAAFPITLAMAAFLLRSLRLVVIPACIFAIGLSITFAVLWLSSQGSLEVHTATPTLTMAVVLATSVGYALVFLSRYCEVLYNRKREGLGCDGTIATREALIHAGETVIVSGLALAMSFLGLCLYQYSMITTLGVASVVGILVVLAATLSLTPLLLLAFHTFWEGAVSDNPRWDKWDQFWDRCTHSRTESQASKDAAAAAAVAEAGVASPHEVDYDSDWNNSFRNYVPERKQGERDPILLPTDVVDRGSVWWLLAMLFTRIPWGPIAIVVVVGATIPASIHATSFRVTGDIGSSLPYDSWATRSYNSIGSAFGYGSTYPYYILLRPTSPSNVTSPEQWQLTQDVIWRLAAGDPNTVQSASVAASSNVTLDHVKECLADRTARIDCPALLYLWEKYLDADQLVMMVEFTSNFAPLSSTGKDWLSRVRDEVEGYPMHVEISGKPAEIIDSMDQVTGNFGLMLSVTAVVVSIMLVLVYGSIPIPLRAVCTRSVTVSFVFGVMYQIYCSGGLTWLTYQGLQSDNDAIMFFVPLVGFPVMVGAGLGPDILLTTRILEIRRGADSDGVDNPTRRAIVLGMCRTGHTTTAAGTVMMVAFAGLLFSSKVPLLNQFACMMTLALAVDTYITRTVLTPAIMGLLGSANWWPFAFYHWHDAVKALRLRCSRSTDAA